VAQTPSASLRSAQRIKLPVIVNGRIARAGDSRVFRFNGRAGEQIAAEVGVSPATVSRILKRLCLNRLSALKPAEPARRIPPPVFARSGSGDAFLRRAQRQADMAS